MNIILLSGGSGKRLWPLSNNIRSKQFIKIFKKENGEYESMIQRMYRMIKTVDENAVITIATSKSQVSSIHNQISTDVGISVEPTRRDTFPAMALASAYLHDVKNVSPDETVLVCPVDPYVEQDFFKALKALSDIASNEEFNLSLMGISPTYPSEKYGYIIPEKFDDISRVSCFKEKPDTETAKEYIKQGALWNSGVFAFKLDYLLNKSKELLGSDEYKYLYNNYDKLIKISFDYAVVEKEKNIQVMRFNGKWKDLGTWNTLAESMSDTFVGDVVLNENCNNVRVINELDTPILAMGLKDVVISASPNGILVSDMGESSYIKPYVDKIDDRIMFAEKSWGYFKIIDVGQNSLTIKVTLNKGHKMNYHSHQNRDEVWTVTSGVGEVTIDGEIKPVQAGDTITMKAGCKHTILAKTELQLIEVQIGEDITVSDKIKYN